MLSVQRLRVLTEVASQGSFSRAAAALAYTPSAVSQAIATLEAETGATLVERDRRGVRPTAAGRVLIDHADSILARLEAAEADLNAVMDVRGGLLRLASFPTAGATLMPLAIARFREAHPGVAMTLAEDEPEATVPRLRAGEFDLALLFEFHGVSESLGPGLERTELLEDPLHVALPVGHPLAAKRRLRLEDLSGQAWVQTSASSPCARHVVRACHAAGFEPHVAFESDDYAVVQGLVAAGVGVALIPTLALSDRRDDIAVRELADGGPSRQIILATLSGAAPAPAVTHMVEIVQHVAERYG